jgi:hypothetical protein
MTTLRAPCWSQTVQGRPCSRSMVWTKTPRGWRAKCECGFSTRAAVGDAAQLDARAELSATS